MRRSSLDGENGELQYYQQRLLLVKMLTEIASLAMTDVVGWDTHEELGIRR